MPLLITFAANAGVTLLSGLCETAVPVYMAAISRILH